MAEKKDEKQKKSGLRKFVEVSAAGSAPYAAGWPVSKLLKYVGNMPARANVDKELNLKLLEAANKRGIEVRKGLESQAESYIFPENVNEAIRKAKARGYRFDVDTPQGPTPIDSLLGKKIVWLEKGLDTNPGQFAHEIGHINDKPRHPDWNHLTITLPKMLAPAAALGTAAIGSARAKTPEGAERAGKAGAIVGLLGGLPMLLVEALASAKGLKIMREQGAGAGQLLRLGATRMLPHFGTYALMAGVPALAAYMIGKAVAHHKREAEKTAAEKKRKEKDSEDLSSDLIRNTVATGLAYPAGKAVTDTSGVAFLGGMTPPTREESELYRRLAEEAERSGHTLLSGGRTATSSLPRALESEENYRDLLKHLGVDPTSTNLKKLRGRHLISINPEWQRPEVLAHEMGHAWGSPSGAFWRRVPGHALNVARVPLTLGTTGAGLLAGSSPEAAEWAGLIGSGMGLATTAPTLLGELSASGRGLMLMRRHGASLGQLGRSAARLAPAFGTYAGSAIPVVAAPYLAGKAVAAYRRRKAVSKEEKSAKEKDKK